MFTCSGEYTSTFCRLTEWERNGDSQSDTWPFIFWEMSYRLATSKIV